jgi:hypothetical protein
MNATMETPLKLNLDEARKAHAILHSPGQQVEIRVLLKDGGAMTGRFDDDAKMLEWLKDADDPGVEVVWWSIQQLIQEPATNDLQRRKGSGNNSVARRNWIIIDIDPIRETDPASDTEINAAIQKTQEIVDWLAARDIGPRLATMTGNGYHLYFPTDGWANDEHQNNMAKVFVGLLDSKFSDENVKVDTASANPGRLGKIPGCISRKGEEKEGRRYRTVQIESTADAPALTPEDVKVLAEAEGYPIQPTRAPRKSGGLDPDFDIYDFAAWCGVTVEAEFEKNGCTYFALDECPIAGHRHRGTLGKTCFIIGDSLGFECFSDDCEGIGIGDVLRKFGDEKGRYERPLFLEPDMSDKFPLDDVDDITETIAGPLAPKEPNAEQVESEANIAASDPDEDNLEPFKIEGEIFLTHLVNAKRLIKAYGNDIRYCFHTKKWYVWTGRRWAVDDKGAIYKKAKRVVQSVLAEAAEIEDPEIRKAFVQHERASESDGSIKAMVSLAQ